MLISSAGTNSPPPLQFSPPDAQAKNPELVANNRAISAAVKLLNDTGAAGASHEFSISIDPTTRQAIVKIVDRSTNEVVEQLPTEYLLQVARGLSERLAQQSRA